MSNAIMSSSASLQPAAGEGASPGVLSEADRALLLALRAWSDECKKPAQRASEADGEHDFILRFWDWLDPTWVERLCTAWDRQAKNLDAGDAAAALERLRRMHAACARVEPVEVHSSWWVRALKDESPAVQRAVAASFPESMRHPLQAELLLDSQDLATDRAPSLPFLGWVLGLWLERLFGGEPERPDDPPAIIAMTRLSARAGYRLCRMVGLGKIWLAGQSPEDARSRTSQRARREWLQAQLSVDDPLLQAQLRRDVQSVVSAKVPERHRAARLGLVTFARLLADFEPFRLRWALQHWPYPIAKLIRGAMPPSSKRLPALLQWESLVLKTAWDRLTLEGRLEIPWPGPAANDTGVH
jgi:hypothetical protein